MRKIWILLILTTSLAGCFSSDPCSFQSEHFLVEIHRIGSDRPSQTIFTDVDEYEELDGLEAALKEIKKVRAPQCAEDVKTNLVDWYEAIIVEF